MIRQRAGARVRTGRIVQALAGTAVIVVSTVALVALPVAGGSAGAAGIVPPTNPTSDVPPQVVPACTSTPADNNSVGCIDSVLHNINYARSLENLGPLVLPSGYSSDSVTMQQLILTDEERGDRGLPEFSGLDGSLNTAALLGATTDADPSPPVGYQYTSAMSIFAQDVSPLGADFAWMYNDGYGGTNLDCTSPTSAKCWGHRNAILGGWSATTSTTPEMGVGATATGGYAEIFANEDNPADALVDQLTGTLPTTASSNAPDVVQVLPASSANTSAGTPVTIEGNYFATSPLPTVDFGGVAATNVHVDWDGELTADAPADPAGTAADTVIVTVSTGAGSSSSTAAAQVNEFTYAPGAAPAITSLSTASGPEIGAGSITIHGSNFIAGDVAPIVDFGTTASVGSLSATGNSVTVTIPNAITPGTVNVTVSTPAGTSPVVAADQFTYTGSGASAAPSITSANAATFDTGTAGAFDVTTSGTPSVSSITDAAFSGCTPSPLPSSVSLVYTGGDTASLAGTPQSGDAGTYTVCLDASNGVAPDATQVFTLTITSPPVSPPPSSPPPSSPPPATPPASSSPPASHGYWLVGSDGGIFSFGSSLFHGSMGGVPLQRPVVGIVPTPDRNGYWLDASDGGVFSFGDTQFYGSMPGLGFNPAGSGKPHSLNAPIVGMVPSHDDGGYFMVASDGGVFAFGDATFAGSCPGIGGCNGAAVAVVPDATGGGYWVVTATGSVYAFGDAHNYGAPGQQGSPITSAVATPDGGGYWILDAAGQVFAYGDASAQLGSAPPGAAGGLDPASSIFSTSDGNGYWVVTGRGKVYNFGDAPFDGDMSGTQLAGPIIAASGS